MNFYSKVKVSLSLLLFSLSGCTSRESVRIHFSAEKHASPFYVARDKGLLKNLRLDIHNGTGLLDSEVVSLLSDGKIDAAIVPFVTPYFRGPKTVGKIVAVTDAGFVTQTRESSLNLLMSRALQSSDDLRGRTFALSWREGAVDSLALARFLKTKGVQIHEVRTVMMRPIEIMRAFKLGSIDAALVPEPYVSGIEKNRWAKRVDQLDTLVEGLVSHCLVMNTKFATTRRVVAAQVLTAYFEGVKTLNAPQISTDLKSSEERLRLTWNEFRAEANFPELAPFADLWGGSLTKD